MSAYTTGPWSAHTHKDRDDTKMAYVRSDATNRRVCSFHGSQYNFRSDDEICANAKLIAAAPELAEALQEMIIGIGEGSIGVHRIEASMAALKKAGLA